MNIHTEFECKAKGITAQAVRYQRRWFVLIHNPKLNTAWTSNSLGIGGRAQAEACNRATHYVRGIIKLPKELTTPIPESKEDYTGTIAQRQRTCSLCVRTYRTHDLLSRHLKVCPSKHFGGMFIPYIPPKKVK